MDSPQLAEARSVVASLADSPVDSHSKLMLMLMPISIPMSMSHEHGFSSHQCPLRPFPLRRSES